MVVGQLTNSTDVRPRHDSLTRATRCALRPFSCQELIAVELVFANVMSGLDAPMAAALL